MRVCHPGPVAFQRARVSGGRRKEISVRALPVFGRPRDLSIRAAVAFPKISGSTSPALRARANVSFVQTGLSRSLVQNYVCASYRFTSRSLAFRRLMTCVAPLRGVNTNIYSRPSIRPRA